MDKIYNEYNNLPLNQNMYHINNANIKSEWYSIDYTFKYEKDKTILEVESKLIEKDNYQISINGKKLLLILAEKKEINRPIYIHHLGKNITRATRYERLRSINIPLPERGYYVRNSHLDFNKHKLIIVLGKTPIVNNNSNTTVIKYA